MAISDILTQEWNNERLGDIQDALTALLRQMYADINGAKAKEVDSINLSIDEGTTILRATVFFADETDAQATVDIEGIVDALDIAVEIVDNLLSTDPQKALSAAAGNELDNKASVVLNHMHWSVDSSSPSVGVGYHERYYCPENHTIYHFYGRIYASEPTTTTLSYQPSKEVVYYDLETATAWRWDGTNMVLAVHPPYFMIVDSMSGTIENYNPATTSGSPYPRLVWFSALSKLVYFYMDGQTRRYVAFDPDPNRVYVRLGTSPKVVQYNGSAWVDVIDISSKANASEVVKSISVNGTAQTKDGSGNVNIQVEGVSSDELSILFVGNSLTQDAVSYLPLVLKEVAPNLKFKFYVWYNGGHTLTQILNKWNNSGKAEIFSVCENVTSWTNYNNSKTIADVLGTYTFDVVCLQEYFNYKRENGYTAEDKQVFNNIVAYLRTNYNKPFKVVSFFHRPLCKNSSNQPDLALADEVFGLTYDGVRWQLENTVSEGVIPTGIAAYRAMYDNTLNSLGTFGYMSYEGTHSQEGLPCLMQAWCCALWLLDKLGIEISINNAQTRVTSSNYSAINVPGPNGSVVVGTAAQDKAAMDIAIKAFKEGKRLEQRFISARGIPAYSIVINGASGTKIERNVQLSASFLPADADAEGVTWSIVSGDATISDAGLVTYNGLSQTASVVVRATLVNANLKAEATISFALAAVETPTFSPAAGTYSAGQSVTINCATVGATIYYTTDGSTPTALSSVYSSPITVNADTTIKAVAMLNDDISNIATAVYTIVIHYSVVVNVSDGNAAITDASVVMSKDGNSYSPLSSSGGAYTFSLPAGTYTLNVSKPGYGTHTGSVVVNQDGISESVTIADLGYVNLFDLGLMVAPLYLYGFSYAAYNGILLQNHNKSNEQNRSSCLCLREGMNNPCTWGSSSTASSDARNTYSLYEINKDYPFILITCSNDYNIDPDISASNPNTYRVKADYNNGGTGWQKSRLLHNTYNDAPVYLTVSIQKADNSKFSEQPTAEGMGLTVVAYKEDPTPQEPQENNE